MAGIFLIFLALLWGGIAFFVAWLIFKNSSRKWLGEVIGVIVFCILLPLPLADELVAKHQFEQLCKENSTIQIDRATAVGKIIYFIPSSPIEVEGRWVPITLLPHRFVDAKTGELVLSYTTLVASGGILSKALGISENRSPLLFDGSCGPTEKIKDIVASLQITALDLPVYKK